MGTVTGLGAINVMAVEKPPKKLFLMKPVPHVFAMLLLSAQTNLFEFLCWGLNTLLGCKITGSSAVKTGNGY